MASRLLDELKSEQALQDEREVLAKQIWKFNHRTEQYTNEISVEGASSQSMHLMCTMENKTKRQVGIMLNLNREIILQKISYIV